MRDDYKNTTSESSIDKKWQIEDYRNQESKAKVIEFKAWSKYMWAKKKSAV